MTVPAKWRHVIEIRRNLLKVHVTQLEELPLFIEQRETAAPPIARIVELQPFFYRACHSYAMAPVTTACDDQKERREAGIEQLDFHPPAEHTCAV